MAVMRRTFFNTAVYIRLSKEDGDKAESDSITNQKRLAFDYLKDKNEFSLYDTYIDDGFTGTNFHRPGFQQMISDIEEGKVNCVIVKDLSRFGRDYIDTGKYLERYFPEKFVRFISITDNIDSFEQTYDMLLPIKNIFNEQYSRDISRKIHASVRTKQKAGEFIGAFPSYGYKKSPTDKNKLIIDEYAAGVVRRVFQMYGNGCGKNRIAAVLNQEGIVCPSEYKRMNGENYRNGSRLETTSYWTYSTINRLLHNEMYAGNMIQGTKLQHMRSRQHAAGKDEWIVVKDTHEAIIDENTWFRTQELLKSRMREPALNTNKSVFAGFLKCGDCGRALVKRSGKPEDGYAGVYYNCGTYVRSGPRYCSPHRVPYAALEQVVLEDLKTLIQNVEDLYDMVQRQNTLGVTDVDESDQKTRRLQGELEKIRRLKKSTYEDYKEELITKEDYLSYRQDYGKKEEQLERQLTELEEKRKTKSDTDVSKNPWIRRLLEFREVEKLDRNIVVEMVHDIQVFEDNKIKITYNFSNN